MHITPVSLKIIHFTIFWTDQNSFLFVYFQKNILTQKLYMSCLCLRHGTYLNGMSNVIAFCWSFTKDTIGLSFS